MSKRCANPDCFNLEPKELDANNDISGTGVLIAFVGTGYLILLILVCDYVLAYDPYSRHLSSSSPSRPNPIDVKLIGCIRSLGRKTVSRLPFAKAIFPDRVVLSNMFSEIILHLCDIQLLTGLAILISGFIVLNCGLSSYHWQIIVYLAWFSAVTHLPALTAIREHLVENPWKRNVRYFLSLANMALLASALTPTAYFSWRGEYERDMFKVRPETVGNVRSFDLSEIQAIPAVCFYDQRSALHIWAAVYCIPFTSSRKTCSPDLYSSFVANGALQATAFSLFLLVFSFVTHTVKLFPVLSNFVYCWTRKPLSEWAQRQLGKLSGASGLSPAPGGGGLRFKLLVRPLLAFFYSIRLHADLWNSMLSDIYWLLSTLLWGTVKLLAARSTQDRRVLEEETEWTFGQILPVLLLATPLFSIAGAFFSRSAQTTKHTCPGQAPESPPPLPPRISASQTPVPSGIPKAQELFSAGYYGKLTCVGPTAVALCGTIFAVTCAMFGSVFNFGFDFEPMFTLYEAWMQAPATLYMVLSLVPACASAMLLGMCLDDLMAPRKIKGRRWRQVAIFLLAGGIQFTYQAPSLFSFTIVSTDVGNRSVPSSLIFLFVMPFIMYISYAFGCIVIAPFKS